MIYKTNHENLSKSNKSFHGSSMACFRHDFWGKGVEFWIYIGHRPLQYDFALTCRFRADFVVSLEKALAFDFFQNGGRIIGFSLFGLMVILEVDCWRAEFFGCLIDRRPRLVFGWEVVDIGLNDGRRGDVFDGWLLGCLCGGGHGCLGGCLHEMGIGFRFTFLETSFPPLFMPRTPLTRPHQPAKAETRFLGFSFKHLWIQYYW